MREQDYHAQFEMMKPEPRPGDNVTLFVWMKCPGCESMLWVKAQFRIRGERPGEVPQGYLYDFVVFETVLYAKIMGHVLALDRQCPHCLKKFPGEGLLPSDRQLCKWMELVELYQKVEEEKNCECSAADLRWLWRQETIEVKRHIPDNRRTSEKRGRARKKPPVTIQREGDYYGT